MTDSPVTAEQLKTLIRTEEVTIGKDKWLCVVSSQELVSATDQVLNRGIAAEDKKRVLKRLLIHFYAHALRSLVEGHLAEPDRVVDALIRLVERHGHDASTDNEWYALLTNLAGCLKKDRATFARLCASLLPHQIKRGALPFNLACVACVHGMEAEALHWLELAAQLEHPLAEITADPDIEPLRAHPRYQAILAVARLHAESTDKDWELDALLKLIKELSTFGPVSQKSIHQLARSVRNWLYAKAKKAPDFDAGLQVVRAWLDHAQGLPLKPEFAQDLAESALNILSKCPDQGSPLVPQIEAKLLTGPMVDAYTYINIAESLILLGHRDRAWDYADRAMDEKVAADCFPARPALNQLYKEDSKFRALVDNHQAQKDALRDYLLTDPDPKDFEAVFRAAQVEFTSYKSYQRAERIVALSCFREPEYRDRIGTFLRSGFDSLRSRLRKQDELINDVMFDAVARAIAEWQDPSFIPMLIEEFKYVTDEEVCADAIPRNYELNLVAGTLAIALSALDYRGSTSFMEPFLEWFEWRYAGEDFIMKTRYGKWLIDQDAQGVLAWLNDPNQKSGKGWAVAALADLNAQKALPDIRDMLKTIKNPITIEVFQEAIHRLETQTSNPAWPDRMIRLFGIISPTAEALGADSDNVFRTRAAQKGNKPRIIVEADQSAEDD